MSTRSVATCRRSWGAMRSGHNSACVEIAPSYVERGVARVEAEAHRPVAPRNAPWSSATACPARYRQTRPDYE